MTFTPNKPALRVVLLRGDDHHNDYLDALLRRNFDVVATVIEPGVEQRRILRRPGKWKDAIAAEYHHARRTILGLNRFRANFFAAARAEQGIPFAPEPDLTVSNINDPAVLRLLAAAIPDICVITCTTILSAATIDSIGVNIINIHGGHLPHYRGCHCFFFALSDGNFDLIGSTIHFVDAGIDTGDILEIVRPAINNNDNAESLYCKAERLAAHRLCSLLTGLANGKPIPSTPQAFRGRLCLRRHRRPLHDVVFAYRRLTGRLSLPTVAEGQQWDRGKTAATT